MKQLEKLGAGMKKLASEFRPAVSATQFLAEFQRYFQVYGEEQYLGQVVRAILDGDTPPAAAECMRAISVNAIPGVVHQAITPNPVIPSLGSSDEHNVFEFDFGFPQTQSISSTPADDLAQTNRIVSASLRREQAQRTEAYLGFYTSDQPRYLTPPLQANSDTTQRKCI